eukprot:Gb_14442 [translate_table: standard]
MVIHCQGFCSSLPLIITTSDPNRIHVAPVCLSLRMFKRISINFTCAGKKEPCTNSLGQSEHVQSSHNIGLYSLDRIVLVMHRRSRTSQMVDLIDLQKQRLHYIMSYKLKPRISKMMHNVFFSSGKKIIHHNNTVPSRHKPVNKMAPYKASSSSNNYPQSLPFQTQRHFSPRIHHGTLLILRNPSNRRFICNPVLLFMHKPCMLHDIRRKNLRL